jgi:hypothetical protein
MPATYRMCRWWANHGALQQAAARQPWGYCTQVGWTLTGKVRVFSLSSGDAALVTRWDRSSHEDETRADGAPGSAVA